jgi:hypothetical protein
MIRHKRYRFSFDEPKGWDAVDTALNHLSDAGIRRSQWFVLVGFNTTLKDDLDRINFLRKRGQLVYLARYNFSRDPAYIPLARWTQCPQFFSKLTFGEFLERPENYKFKEYWKDQFPK